MVMRLCSLSLIICILGSSCGIRAQSTSKLKVVYPLSFIYDSVGLSNQEGKLLSSVSVKEKNGRRTDTYTISREDNKIAVHIASKPSGIADTLYFYPMGGNMEINFLDSFSLKDRRDYLSVKNMYNYETINKEYELLKNEIPKDYDRKLKYFHKRNVTLAGYYQDRVLSFLRRNINDPYVFVIFFFYLHDPFYQPEYTIARNFYDRELKGMIKDSILGKEIETKIETIENTKVGHTAPRFTVRDTKGTVLNSDSLSSQNVFLIFWASWCTPCINELPELKKIYEKYEEENIVFISVSLDNPKDSVKAMDIIRQNGIGWHQVFNQRSVIMDYNINPIPAIFVIGSGGKIEYSPESGGLKKLNNYLESKFGY